MLRCVCARSDPAQCRLTLYPVIGGGFDLDPCFPGRGKSRADVPVDVRANRRPVALPDTVESELQSVRGGDHVEQCVRDRTDPVRHAVVAGRDEGAVRRVREPSPAEGYQFPVGPAGGS